MSWFSNGYAQFVLQPIKYNAYFYRVDRATLLQLYYDCETQATNFKNIKFYELLLGMRKDKKVRKVQLVSCVLRMFAAPFYKKKF